MTEPRCRCWWCGGPLVWDNDFNSEEVTGEGDRLVTFLHCADCNAEVRYLEREP